MQKVYSVSAKQDKLHLLQAIHLLKQKESSEEAKVTSNIIPLLAGYRHNFSGFYAEPQVGYSIVSTKIKGDGISVSVSDGAFAWAIGFGYMVTM